MALEEKTYEELVEIELAAIKNRQPDRDVSPGSDADIDARVHATMVEANQAAASFLVDQVNIGTSSGEYLVRHASDRGIEKRAAKAAAGSVLLVSTTEGDTMPKGTTLTSPTGITYTLTKDATTRLPTWWANVAAGSTVSRIFLLPHVADIEPGDVVLITTGGVAETRVVKEVHESILAIELYEPLSIEPESGVTTIVPAIGVLADADADETGASTNAEAGTVFSYTPLADFDGEAIVQEMTGGSDEQTIEELKAETLAFEGGRPASGNAAHYREEARSTPNAGIVDAFVYPNLRGLGTVDIVPLGVAGARLTGKTTNARILAHLRSVFSDFDDIAVRSFIPSWPEVNVHVEVEAQVGYEADWEGTKTTHAVTASTTTVLQLDAEITGIELGDRVVVPVTLDTGREATEERVVSKIVNAGPGDYQLHLGEPLSAAPDAGATIRPGGPLYAPIVEAIEALFDSLGPGDTDAITGQGASRWPRPAEEWPANLHPSDAIVALRAVPGVARARSIYPADGEEIVAATLFRLTLGRVLVDWS